MKKQKKSLPLFSLQKFSFHFFQSNKVQIGRFDLINSNTNLTANFIFSGLNRKVGIVNKNNVYKISLKHFMKKLIIFNVFFTYLIEYLDLKVI